MTVNLGIPSPLLSRFDVVLLLLDTPNETWDNAASKFLLEGVDMLKNLKKDEDTNEEDIDGEYSSLKSNFIWIE